jgi:hypothetical protein
MAKEDTLEDVRQHVSDFFLILLGLAVQTRPMTLVRLEYWTLYTSPFQPGRRLMLSVLMLEPALRGLKTVVLVGKINPKAYRLTCGY